MEAIGSAAADGLSFERAFFVGSVEEEYDWLNLLYRGFTMKEQALIYHKEKPFDLMTIILADGIEKTIHFDISEFFDEESDDLPDWLK